MRNKIFYILAPVSIMGIIFIFSSQPYHEQDLRPAMNDHIPLDVLEPLVASIEIPYHNRIVSVESHGVAGMIEFIIRKFAHFAVFFTLMVAMYIATTRLVMWSFPTRWLTSFVVTIAYAGFDEFHQSLTPNRTPYVGDVVLDGAGALAAGILILLFHRRSS
ncbi:VanZ family protein [Halobacillus locisalis]|uniref:VanZ family protein n=1 Tax=Halobacillus locisalis TaxID=220753 RepID=A0A838CU76_9BACI|nr:VanZ family protein [Halobacillus locisalis]MBA2175530.1 VanZ family protein [Halobacillus locisalis]